jgi:hypothetical protein
MTFCNTIWRFSRFFTGGLQNGSAAHRPRELQKFYALSPKAPEFANELLNYDGKCHNATHEEQSSGDGFYHWRLDHKQTDLQL